MWGEHFKYSIQNVQTLPASTEHNLLGMEAVNIAHSLDMLHLQVTEKAYFHLAKAFSTTLRLANAEEQACELFILRDKGAKKGFKKPCGHQASVYLGDAAFQLHSPSFARSCVMEQKEV